MSFCTPTIDILLQYLHLCKKKIHKSPNHVFSLYNPSQNFNLLSSSIFPYPSLA